jgi:hypothetical protein
VLKRLSTVRTQIAAAVLAGVGMYSGLPPALREWRLAHESRRPLDVVTMSDQRFRVLVSALPRKGTIGYLPPPDWPGVDAVRQFYLAQFALTPRLVVFGTDAEFVIAVPEAVGPRAGDATGDARLATLSLEASFSNGLKVFRRMK